MKFKTTQKAIRAGYPNVICVSYCRAQNLLQGKNPVAYTTRREGWGADIYEIDSATAIATGYAPFGNIKPEYEITAKYDELAEKIWRNIADSYEERVSKVDTLIQQYVEEVLG